MDKVYEFMRESGRGVYMVKANHVEMAVRKFLDSEEIMNEPPAYGLCEVFQWDCKFTGFMGRIGELTVVYRGHEEKGRWEIHVYM